VLSLGGHFLEMKSIFGVKVEGSAAPTVKEDVMESANFGEMGKVEHAAPIKMLDLQSKTDKPCVVKFHGDFGAETGRNSQTGIWS
jgi:hypothetical protein